MLAGNTIGEKGKETVLNVTLPAALDQGAGPTFASSAAQKIGDAEFQTAASTAAPLKAAFNGWAYPPANLDGLIGLGVGPAFADFYQLSAPGTALSPSRSSSRPRTSRSQPIV